MRSKAAPTKTRHSRQTQARRARSIQAESVKEDPNLEVERPLDAEDVALAALEAQVREKEARADLGSTGPDSVVALRLSHAVVSRLEAEAKRRRITPAELIKRAIVHYLGI